ncbi:hypothetical protein [Shewanella xiamenensis]|uniref:hypothetical protein n=1 Tax=Shewanella xiamenensis TaxID=332186 RepID=UPI001CC33DBA|nr:hypothetical protein [Shewanella xiamenensis]BDA63089.1 hypothetical protein NUITMVS1_45520 [Shewanella xiamenensis]
MENQQVETLLASWLNTGHEYNPEFSLFKHPEFIFRKSGEWMGWNSFLGQSEGSASFDNNEKRDHLDNQAWQLYLSRFHR